MNSRSRRGMVLLIALSFLVLLSLIGTVFVRLQTVEKRVAGCFTDQVRAKLLAESAVEEAVERLQEDMFLDSARRPSVYWGDVTNETAPGSAPNPLTPIGASRNPSYAVEAASLSNPAYDPYQATDPTPATLIIDGQPRGVSMIMSTGTYGTRSDVGTLRVVGTQGLLNLNDGVHEDTLPCRPVTMNLRRMLNHLGSLPAVGLPTLGDVVLARPPGGFKSKRELRVFLGAAVYDVVKNLVTVHGAVDRDVALPVPNKGTPLVIDIMGTLMETSCLGNYPAMNRSPLDHPEGQLWRGSTPSYRRARGVNYRGASLSSVVGPWMLGGTQGTSWSPHVQVWGYDELSPTWIQVTSRSPVAVNEAPREVLIATLADLQGWFVMEARRHVPDTLSPT